MTTWIALESNPEVLTKYIHKLGVSPLWSLTDVFGLEPDQLEWLPGPVQALILLFPCSNSFEKYSKEQDEELKANPPKVPEDLFFLKQYIHNACGAIALVHSVANNPAIEIEDGSILKKYLDEARDLTPEKRGKLLENDKSFTDAHQEVAVEGQTDANSGEPVNHHFVAFINFNGQLYEMDGRKTSPIPHGKTSEESFLKDAAKLCKQAIERDPEDVSFSVIALAPTQD
ncbi:ubiquitin carboxyl-terminal hydrolase [Contarinia nasturtii]|uniref:ubiquitin carboxyl-terminal hydrolase n=1 Tax=Contarinia nasturtii TaxID=265458 RepID=UPI0012D39B39|nr:ubiquitin carboxyl-terminal hydrolase [Contarinia nasturtii]